MRPYRRRIASRDARTDSKRPLPLHIRKYSLICMDIAEFSTIFRKEEAKTNEVLLRTDVAARTDAPQERAQKKERLPR